MSANRVSKCQIFEQADLSCLILAKELSYLILAKKFLNYLCNKKPKVVNILSRHNRVFQ
jgi:hypothetical protein